MGLNEDDNRNLRHATKKKQADVEELDGQDERWKMAGVKWGSWRHEHSVFLKTLHDRSPSTPSPVHLETFGKKDYNLKTQWCELAI